MFSELTTAIRQTLVATGLVVSTTLIVAYPTLPAVGDAFSYDAPLFTCESGKVLYNRIVNNKSITLKERQDLVRTLMADMPNACTTLQKTAKNYCEFNYEC